MQMIVTSCVFFFVQPGRRNPPSWSFDWAGTLIKTQFTSGMYLTHCRLSINRPAESSTVNRGSKVIPTLTVGTGFNFNICTQSGIKSVIIHSNKTSLASTHPLPHRPIVKEVAGKRRRKRRSESSMWGRCCRGVCVVTSNPPQLCASPCPAVLPLHAVTMLQLSACVLQTSVPVSVNAELTKGQSAADHFSWVGGDESFGV